MWTENRDSWVAASTWDRTNSEQEIRTPAISTATESSGLKTWSYSFKRHSSPPRSDTAWPISLETEPKTDGTLCRSLIFWWDHNSVRPRGLHHTGQRADFCA